MMLLLLLQQTSCHGDFNSYDGAEHGCGICHVPSCHGDGNSYDGAEHGCGICHVLSQSVSAVLCTVNVECCLLLGVNSVGM